jgi:predicted P-type ATPase
MNNHQNDDKSLELKQIGSSKSSDLMPPSGGIRSYQVVNDGTDDQFILYGYSRSIARTIITWTFIVLTVGFLRLVFYWKPNWFLRCCCSRTDLSVAQYVLLKDRYKQWYVETVLIINNNQNPSDPNDSRNFLSTNRARYDSFTDRQQVDNRDIHRYFINKRWRYVWNEAEYKFTKLLGIEDNVKCDYFRQIRPLTVEERAKKKILHGENSSGLRLTPIISLLIKEVLSPFYIFQLFSCISWFADEYVTYASCIVFITVVSVIVTLYEVRKNERALRDTVHQSEVTTVVIYNPQTNEEEQRDIISEDLVPGDIIIVRSSTTMQCDAVLLNGNVIVNESMLTGESIPVTKVQIPYYQSSSDHPALNQSFDIREHNRFILFSGTSVIQTRYYGAGDVRAVVIRTAFSTAKGELIRSILYPKPVDFKFNTDTYRYVGGMALIAFGGMIFSIVLRIMRHEPFVVIFKRTIDVITIAVPPALPAALSAGLVYAQTRLKKDNIFCISPRSINICGSINTVVFDKTGTLTEDGLDLQCVLPIQHLHNSTANPQQIEFGSEITEVTDLNWHDEEAHSMIIVCMAACHTLTRINGELAGDPLDLKMLAFTQYELYEPAATEQANFDMLFPTIVRPISSSAIAETRPGRLSGSVSSLIAGNIPFEIGIVRQLPFSSSLQRTSVIVRILAKDSFDLLTKGSPEKIAELSRPETIPKNFNEILTTYAKQGYRVLALAYKPIELNYVKIQRIEREKIEHDLIFLGLVVMENRLKPQTEGVLKILSNANIRTIMCTGDNMLTALSVARDCDMIPDDAKIIAVEATEPNSTPTFTYAQVFNRRVKEVRYDLNSHRLIELDRRTPYHFAISGKSFQIVRDEHPELLRRLCVRGTVFARMLPEQKQQLIETLQELG